MDKRYVDRLARTEYLIMENGQGGSNGGGHSSREIGTACIPRRREACKSARGRGMRCTFDEIVDSRYFCSTCEIEMYKQG